MTHTTKHTPGPWVVEKGWNGDRPTITAKVSKTQVIDNRGLIADLEHTPLIEHAQANARLIAAAPAMYEALKGCLRVTEAWKSQAEMNGDTVEIEAAVMEIRRIKAALAQAEGQHHE